MLIEVLDGVYSTPGELRGRYQLIAATKGDMLDQEEKLTMNDSGNWVVLEKV